MHIVRLFVAIPFIVKAAYAASMTFWTLDELQRTVHFTANFGYAHPAPVEVNNQQNVTVAFEDGFGGNFYAVQAGQQNIPGMLGEVSFSGWAGLTYFDVSAIVAPNDTNNIKQIWPTKSGWPISGCETFPCNNCYRLPDDNQTKTTLELDLISTLGTGV